MHRLNRWVAASLVVLLLGSMVAPVALFAQAPAENAGAQAQGGKGLKVSDQAAGMIALAVAVVVGAGCIGAGLAVARVGSAALGAATERPEMLGRSLILVGLAEGIAIYGLIVGIMLLGLVK